MALVNLLGTGPGSSVYHFLVLLALEAMAGIAFIEWRRTHSPDRRRVLWAFGGLLVMYALLLFGESFGPVIIAPFTSGMEVASLALLGWAFLAPDLSHRTRTRYLVGGLGATFLCAVTFLPVWYRVLAQFPHLLYLTFWQQTFWYAVSVLLALAPALLLLRSQQRRELMLPAVGFGVLCLGFATLLVGSLLLTVGQPDIAGYTLIGVGRVINMFGYPLFAVAVHRIALRGRRTYRQKLRSMSKETLHQARELQFLVEAGRTIGQTLDLDTVLQRLVESIAKALGADLCAAFLVNQDMPGTVSLAARYTPFQRTGRLAGQSTFSLAEQSTLAYALKRHNQLTFNVDTDDPRLQTLYGLLDSQETGPTIVQPLLCQRRVLGALVVGNNHSQRAFEPDEGRLCRSIAVQAAVAVEHALLYRSLKTQLDQLTESLRPQEGEVDRQTAILESVAEGVIVSNSEDRVVMFNATAEQILGVPRQRILGEGIARLADHVPLVPKGDWRMVAESGAPCETVFELEDRVVHVSAAPVLTPAGDHLGIVAILRDITEETQAERARSEFITAVSRELLTPITAIRGYAEAISSGMVGPVSDSQSRLLSVIRDNALRAVSLTDNLVAVSQIEKGFLKLEYGDIDLRLLVDDVVHSFQRQFEARQLNVSLEIDDDLSQVEADPARVRQILDNLVSNAVKFTYPGGHIVIGAKPLRDGQAEFQAHCAIWVSDTGIGIHPDDLAHIWERFYRPSSPLATEASGLGVGLSIVKSLVEAHGGRAWVESTPGAGSTFTVVLPINHGLGRQVGG